MSSKIDQSISLRNQFGQNMRLEFVIAVADIFNTLDIVTMRK